MAVLRSTTRINPETGETERFVLVRSKLRDVGFLKLFREGTQFILESIAAKRLNTELTTLWWFFSRMQDFPAGGEGWIPCPPEEIAEATGVSIQTVRKHLLVLRSLGILEQRGARQAVYRVSPSFAYRGVLREHREQERQKRANESEG